MDTTNVPSDRAILASLWWLTKFLGGVASDSCALVCETGKGVECESLLDVYANTFASCEERIREEPQKQQSGFRRESSDIPHPGTQ